jgi:hypothetical protein
VEVKLYPGRGHVSILIDLAIPFRRRAPVLADVAAFALRVTAPAANKTVDRRPRIP